MDNSTEIRWFSTERFTDVERWFKDQGKQFKNQWQQSDFYVRLDGYPKLSFKIREGKAEIKTLVNEPAVIKISNTCSGIVEHWIKWSKPLSGHLTATQIFDDKNVLIELKKERLLITYSINEGGINIANDYANEGCQVELTRLSIENQLYYSFAFEAFGSDDRRTSYLNTITTLVLGEFDANTKLSTNDSYGYPVLLSNIVK
jgi:hypothetical protein